MRCCCCCCCYEELLVSFCLNACFPILFGWNCLFENKFLEIGGVAQQLRVHVVLLEAQSLVVVPVLGAHSCLQPLGPVVPMTSFGFHWSTHGIRTWTPILENKFSSLSHCLLLFHIRNEQYYVWKTPLKKRNQSPSILGFLVGDSWLSSTKFQAPTLSSHPCRPPFWPPQNPHPQPAGLSSQFCHLGKNLHCNLWNIQVVFLNICII